MTANVKRTVEQRVKLSTKPMLLGGWFWFTTCKFKPTIWALDYPRNTTTTLSHFKNVIFWHHWHHAMLKNSSSIET